MRGKGAKLSILMVDIDHFKSVNDEYGHKIGDRVLKEVAQLMKKNVRGEDVVTRYGGEEFVIILPDSGLEEAKIAAEKLRKVVEKKTQNQDYPPVTISIGCSQLQTVNGELNGAKKIQEAADIALYNSKANGRNRVTTYSEGMSMPPKEEEAKIVDIPIPKEIVEAGKRLLEEPGILEAKKKSIRKELPEDRHEQIALLQSLIQDISNEPQKRTGTDN